MTWQLGSVSDEIHVVKRGRSASLFGYAYGSNTATSKLFPVRCKRVHEEGWTATVTSKQGSTYRWLWCDCDWPNLYDHLAFYYLGWLEFHLIQKSQSSRGSQTRCLVGAQLALKILRKQNLAFTPSHGLRKSGLTTTCLAWEVPTMKCDTQNDVDLCDRTSPKVKFLEVWNAYAKCKSNF